MEENDEAIKFLGYFTSSSLHERLWSGEIPINWEMLFPAPEKVLS